MSDYDTDDMVDFLVTIAPLADVLAFVEARDDVRRIPAGDASAAAPTIPARAS